MAALRVETIVVGPIQTNCYVVWPEGQNRCWIIDPGGLPSPITAVVKQYCLEPQMLVITHGHWDHFVGNRCLKNRWPNLSIAVHEMDAPALPDPGVNLSVSLFGKLIKSPPADRLLKDGEHLSLGEFDFEVIHTPGHSPGSVCLYCPGQQVVFVGDLIFEGGGVGRTDLPHGSTEELYRSIEKLFRRIAPETIIYPGHGPKSRADRERMMFV
jgi:glyoxylase-like metal-dependent hydrolase (beta-lactamase superfamily II)